MQGLDRSIWNEYMQGKQSLGKEECPLCADMTYVVKAFEYWTIFKNKYPYAGVKDHFLLVPKRHIEHVKELIVEEYGELSVIEKYFSDYFGERDYFSFIRHTNSGKTIKHIHYHYLPGVLYADTLEEMLIKQGF